jgi:hypothetical protein
MPVCRPTVKMMKELELSEYQALRAAKHASQTTWLWGLAYAILLVGLIVALVLSSIAYSRSTVAPPLPPEPVELTNNTFLYQATWYVDPLNGNDKADGLTPTTAVRTYSEITIRWGVETAPLLHQTTTITFLNDQPDFSDPIIFTGNVIGGLFLVGQLTNVTHGTFTAVTPRNRTAAQKWEVQDVSKTSDFWTPYLNTLVWDTTAGCYLWVDNDLGNETATTTEPMGPATFDFPTPPYVTPHAGDAYVIQRQTQLYVLDFSPITVNGFASEMSNVWIITPAPFSSASVNAFVFMNLVRADPTINLGHVASFPAPTISNCFFGDGASMGPGVTALGGEFDTIFIATGGISPVVLDGDMLVAATLQNWLGIVVFGAVYIQGDLELPNLGPFGGGSVTLVVSNDAFYFIPAVWGPGAINVHTGGILQYSAGTAAAAFLKTGGIMLEGLSTANALNTSVNPGLIYTGRTLSPALLDAPLASGGFNGYAFGNHGTVITAVH